MIGNPPDATDPELAARDGESERLRRWRLALGTPAQESLGACTGSDAAVDKALAALYDSDSAPGRGGRSGRSGGLGASAPRVARWLGDIREYFPSSVVQVMQADAIDRLGLTQMLMEPEMLEAVEPDVHLVGTLMSLNRSLMPAKARDAARMVVAKVVAELEAKLARKTQAAVTGALDRATRTNRPRRTSDIDWDRTIRANMRHYLPEHGTVIPQRLIGYGRRSPSVQRDVVLCVDQSGSMAPSVVYAGVFSAVLASIRTLRTSMVVFDTAVVDLTEQLADPVEVLFGTQLGGGTDINRALAYTERLITRPRDTILVLISDLYEGGDRRGMLRRVAELARSGVQMVALLALSDEGAPGYDHRTAAAFVELGVPAFACTPDRFPDLMAAAIERRDLTAFAEQSATAGRR